MSVYVSGGASSRRSILCIGEVMAATETPTALGPCPTDEELAAFLDGTLTKAERARVIAHLADCESCYEIFAGSVHFLHDSPPVEAGGQVLPFVSKREGGGGGIRRWLPAAAAAVVVAGLGYGGYRELSSPPSLAALVAPVAHRPGVAEKINVTRFRGGGDSDEDLFSLRPAFLVGARMVDLRLSLQAGDRAKASDLLLDMGNQLKKISFLSFLDDEANRHFEEARLLSARATDKNLRRIAASLPAREKDFEDFLGPSFDFGKWTEAGRLAAETQAPGFFGWRNRWYLRRLLKNKDDYEEGVAEHLAEIQRIWDRGDLQSKDYQELSRQFGEIVRSYDY
jgi:hypothetical protein